MSIKLPKRLSTKKTKLPKNNAQAEALNKLGLEDWWTTPLDPASMLDISTWTLETQTPLELKDLPKAFLQRLWLLHPDARSSCCKPQHIVTNSANESTEKMTYGFGESQCAINPLDLVTAVFMSANTFLQQEMMIRMAQCQFAVPLVLPSINPEELGRFLLWPLRGIVSQWRSHFLDKNRNVHEGDLASTHMPMVSFVKLGQCGISKSQVLNNVIRSPSETFLHRGIDGGQLPRRLSNGLIEIGWYLPTGDTARDSLPAPMVIANLRGDAGIHEKHFSFLCHVSSAVVIFCGHLREKEKQFLASCKDKASKIILIELSDTETNENRTLGFVDQNLEEDVGLPGGSVLQGRTLSEEELANRLCDILTDLLPDKLKLVTLETAAKLAREQGFNVDEGAICKKVMATVVDILKGLDAGSVQFREKQLPLQGPLWCKVAEIEKDERQQRKEGKEPNPQLQKEKRDILVELSNYKMTPAMKIFIDALFTKDKVERTYFLSWMKLKLELIQSEKQNSPQDTFTTLQAETEGDIREHAHELENGADDNLGDSDSFCTDSTSGDEQSKGTTANTELQVPEQQFEKRQELEHVLQKSTEKTINLQSRQKEHLESTHDPVLEKQVQATITCGILSYPGKQQDEPELALAKSDLSSCVQQQICQNASSEHQVASCSQPSETDPSSLGLEHFLREMGLIFELTHMSPSSGSQNVLRLPSLAVDLLLFGVPLELMDGDASNIPIHWLGCVFAELKRRLPQEHCRTRVLANIGVHHARNTEVLSALFAMKFPKGRKTSTRGIYMVILGLPDKVRKDMKCEFLLLVDVKGLCSDKKSNMLIHDNEMATVVTGLSDILIQNISSQAGTEFETNFIVIVNALLRIKEGGSFPICQFLAQDEELNTVLQVSQLRRISDMLKTETRDRSTNHAENHSVKTTSCVTFIKGPWYNISFSEPVDTQYSKAVLKLKQNLFGALKTCAPRSEAKGLTEFMNRLSAVWDVVRADSFAIGLQDTDTALTFSLFCTEFSQWETSFLEHMESWLMGATEKIFNTNAKALDAVNQNGVVSELKDEARREVKTEVDKLRSQVEVNMMKEELLKMNTFKPVLMSYIDVRQERVTKEMMQRLEAVNKSHCSSTHLTEFETLLKTEQESKIHKLIEISKSTKVLLQDAELEQEFEGVWSKTLSNFDFSPSETDDITERVTNILKENLVSRGLQKHMKKVEVMGRNQTSGFSVYDEHFGYRCRLKHMFEGNNRLQKLEAEQVACNIIEEYNQFVADKSSSLADFSDSYITELLQNIEKALKKKSMETRSAFEVDLKVYLCSTACQDFQKLNDRYAKDREFLTCISATKSKYLAECVYHFRKRDQCQRVAHAFTSMVIKPTVLDYIYKPLGRHIVDEIQSKNPQFQSRRAFHQSLLEDLIKEDCFESFLEYLQSFDNFRLKKVQKTVLAHLSESSNPDKWRQQRLGEIVGKTAAAVSETTAGTNGLLSDAKPLLERVCLTLEIDGDVDVTRAPLDGSLFSITTDWDRFVTCLIELLAAMRLELTQDFSQNGDIIQFTQYLPIQPHEALLNRVRGCDKQCPFCRAPCDVENMRHEVHRALLHRPKGTMRHNSCSLTSTSCPGSMTEGTPVQGKDKDNMSVACRCHSLYPDWIICPEDPTSQMPIAYWRYVLTRFNGRFAMEYKQDLAVLPDEWKKITEEEALYSLKEAFSQEC